MGTEGELQLQQEGRRNSDNSERLNRELLLFLPWHLLCRATIKGRQLSLLQER